MVGQARETTRLRFGRKRQTGLPPRVACSWPVPLRFIAKALDRAHGRAVGRRHALEAGEEAIEVDVACAATVLSATTRRRSALAGTGPAATAFSSGNSGASQ